MLRFPPTEILRFKQAFKLYINSKNQRKPCQNMCISKSPSLYPLEFCSVFCFEYEIKTCENADK